VVQIVLIFFYRERRHSIGVWSCPGADRVGMRVGVRAAVRYLYGQISGRFRKTVHFRLN
jgi:hypothetical protein